MSGIREPQPASSHYLSPNMTNFSRNYNEQTVLNDSSSGLQTKFKQTGYIIGPPVAYTNEPILPSNFRPFSPQKPTHNQMNNLPVVFSTSNSRSREHAPVRNVVSSSPIKYAPQTQYIHVNNHQMPVPVNSETVPRITYERCVSECKNWETKYNELHLKYLNATTGGQSSSGLRQENERLRQRVRQLEAKQRGFYEKLEMQFSDLVSKYRDSTMKQCLLLMDRYRLECKHAERER